MLWNIPSNSFLLDENHEVCPFTHNSFYDLALLGNEKYFKGSSHFFKNLRLARNVALVH